MQTVSVFMLIVLCMLPFFMRPKRMAGVMCAALTLLLTCSCALADGFTAVPKERMYLHLPDGMAASEQRSDGEMKLAINTAKTDWGLALVESSDTSYVCVDTGIVAPAHAAYYVAEFGNGTDEEALDGLNLQTEEAASDGFNDEYYQVTWDDRTLRNGQVVAFCVNDYRIIQPFEEDCSIYVRWFDSDQKEICTEKLHFTNTHTVSRGVYAPLYLIDSEDILANVDSLSGVQSRTAPGEVVYTVGAQSSKQNRQVITGVRMPEGAVRCESVSLFDGNETLTTRDGYALVKTRLPRTGAPKTTVGLKFYDGEDHLIGCGSLAIQCRTSEMEPWAAYMNGWDHVPADHLSIAINGQSGIQMPYEDGILSYDYSEIVSDPELLRNCTAQVSVTPPEKAAFVRMNCSGGGEGLLGNHGNIDEVNDWISWCDPEAVTGQYSAFETRILSEINTYDGVTLFVPNTPTLLDAGLIYYFYWYESEEAAKENKPFAIWWFAERSAPFVKTIVNPLQKTESGLSSGYDGAVAVGDEGLSLVTEYYLQEGENAQHYELHLVDANGNAVSPDRDMVIYLPYPEGCAYDDGTTYTLRHYAAGGVSEHVTTLTPTEIGLRFEISSFSPFVLTWSGTSAPNETPVPADTPAPAETPVPDVSQLPRTGDSTPVGWLIGTLALAAACLWLLLSRRRRA